MAAKNDKGTAAKKVTKKSPVEEDSKDEVKEIKEAAEGVVEGVVEEEVEEAVEEAVEEEVILTALEMPAAAKVPLDVREIDIQQIALHDNIRMPTEHGVERLAETLHLEGQLQPCVVRPASKESSHEKPFELIFGHRRLAAATFLKWETIRCEVREIPDDHTITQMIVEYFQREDLSPVAEARAMYALKNSIEPPLSNAEVARALGCDPSHVSHRLTMIAALTPPPPPPEEEDEEEIEEDNNDQEETEEKESAIKPETSLSSKKPIDILELVDQGQISGSTAEVIASLEDSQDQQKLAKIVIRNEWGSKKAAAWARQVKENQIDPDQGTEEMGEIGMIEMDDVIDLPHLKVRPDLSKPELSRVVLYALLRNGMDQEMLDYLAEEMGYPYEALWDYVSSISDKQVVELTERQAIRYISAAHRWFDLEVSLKDKLGLPEEAPGSDQLEAAETALQLPPIEEMSQEEESDISNEDDNVSDEDGEQA